VKYSAFSEFLIPELALADRPVDNLLIEMRINSVTNLLNAAIMMLVAIGV
jgi:hypothetical protein